MSSHCTSSTATTSGRARGERTQRVQEADPDRMRIRRRPLGFFEHERARQRTSLPGGEGRERVLEHGLEQVADAREAERRLALGRQRPQHPETSLLGLDDRCRPERGLPHAGLAFEDERHRSVGDAGDEVIDGGELGVPADDDVGHASAIVRLPLRRD